MSQAKLAERTTPNSSNPSRKVVSLLAGMIRDHRDRSMPPSHTRNHGRRYRYYVSHMGDDAGRPHFGCLPENSMPLSARSWAAFLGNTDRTRELVSAVIPGELGKFVEHCRSLSQQIAGASVPELRATLQSLDMSIRVDPAEITASFCGSTLLRNAGIDADIERTVFTIPAHQASFGHETRLRLDPQSSLSNPTEQRLIEVIARSFAAREQLLAMSESDLAAMPVTQLRHLQRIARLSYLAPAIIRSVLDGTQPNHLTARNLWRQEKLPVLWADQCQAMGIASP